MALEAGKKYRVTKDYHCYSQPDIVTRNRWLKVGDIIKVTGLAVRGQYEIKVGDRIVWGYPTDIEMIDE